MFKDRQPAEIYALSDPITGQLRYIGKANDSAERLKSHLRDANRRDTPVYRWIRKLTNKGLAPAVKVLEVTHDWQESERRLIALSRARGDKLLNVADGGDEPACSTAVRSSNAVALNQRLAADPLAKRVRDIKRAMMTAANLGQLPDTVVAKLHLAASKRPDLFGCFSAIQMGGYRGAL